MTPQPPGGQLQLKSYNDTAVEIAKDSNSVGEPSDPWKPSGKWKNEASWAESGSLGIAGAVESEPSGAFLSMGFTGCSG